MAVNQGVYSVLLQGPLRSPSYKANLWARAAKLPFQEGHIWARAAKLPFLGEAERSFALRRALPGSERWSQWWFPEVVPRVVPGVVPRSESPVPRH